MRKKLDSVRFNLTESMALELIKFNELKKQLNDLKESYKLDKNNKLLLQIKNLEIDLLKIKTKFIEEFRINNYNEIIEYIKIRDQK